MVPRIRIPAQSLRSAMGTPYVCLQCRHASLATVTATTPAAPIEAGLMSGAAPSIARRPPSQPSSHKPPEFRKTQLHRQYQSLLRASPLMLIFQHNNVKSTEFTGLRRELAVAMRKVDEELAKQGHHEYAGAFAKLQVVQTGLFASALKVVEFWNPTDEAAAEQAHGLSRAAWWATKAAKQQHGLEPLMSGPLCVMTIPAVSPQHLKAALSILSPGPAFPAPKRKMSPGYYEPAVQTGLQKLMLLGARIEGKAFDVEGAQWVGGIQGGLEGLRGQLVAMLQGVGAGVTSTLSAASTSLYLTMESRKTMLEDESKPKGEGEGETQ